MFVFCNKGKARTFEFSITKFSDMAKSSGQFLCNMTCCIFVLPGW